MIVKRIHKILCATDQGLIEIASMVTQIIMEHGSKCSYIELDASSGTLTFITWGEKP